MPKTSRQPAAKRTTATTAAMTIEEMFCFSGYTPEQLAETYGSLDAAKARFEHLVAIGRLREDAWDPKRLTIIDADDLS